jgi:ABC-type dipeptide/oligopeptide/nickel transport system permease component
MRSLSRDAIVALTVSALMVVAMAIDHLVGTESDPDEESGLADPGAFVLSVTLSLALTALLFGVVVRRARNEPADAAVRGIVCSAPAIPAVVLAFLGLPYPLAGAGIALGLHGREGRRRRLASAAVAIGALVVTAITVGYVLALIA